MHATTRVALIQLAWSGSIESMQSQYRQLIPQAVQQGASLVCLPEFSLIPYRKNAVKPPPFMFGDMRRKG